MTGVVDRPPVNPGRVLSSSDAYWTRAAFLALLVMSLAGQLLTGQSASLSGEGNVFRQVIYVLIFGLLLAATFRTGGLDEALRTSLPINLTLLYCWASLVWAINPGVGMRRVILTTMFIYSVFLAVEALGRDKTLAVIKAGLVTTLALNYATVILMPGIGIHQFQTAGDPGLVGDWRGLIGDKNFTGSVTAVTFLILWFDPRSKSNLFHLGLIAASLFFLVQTGSKTSLGIGLAALLAGLAYRRYDWRYWPVAIISLALFTLLAGLAAIANRDILRSTLDQPDAFTGRTQIWSPLLAFLQDHWLAGAGYGSFWNVGPDSPIYSYAKNGAWLTKITSAHNGYLEVAVQIGLPGLLIAIFALYLRPLGRLLSYRGHQRGGLPPALLIFCAGHNLTESTMLDRDSFVQFCLVWTIAAISRETRSPSDPASWHMARFHPEADLSPDRNVT